MNLVLISKFEHFTTVCVQERVKRAWEGRDTETQYSEWTYAARLLNSATCPPMFMQFAGCCSLLPLASSLYVLARKCN